ncbi:MAG: radical SAM protein [Candidatus Lokiarchaeota archaeon]|nr:radical SAM protein [Candidatus Lokiarchaeota archaeon]
MPNIHKILANKTKLLYKGIYIDKKKFDFYFKSNFGRKGGAGPYGGRYFVFEDNKTLVNVALWKNSIKSELSLKYKNKSLFEVFNRENKSSLGVFRLIESPRYCLDNLRTSDNILMSKIALVHGFDCLASTIYQKCDYWQCGTACKFCGIEISLNNKSTILEKSPEQISEVITEAKRENRCSHITLTTGSEHNEKNVVFRYINILKKLKEDHPKIPIHIQLEPVYNPDYLNQLKDSGADTIGIHIEILDENIRKYITPGKSHISYQLYRDNWKNAIDIFGKNQVESYILVGLGEDIITLTKSIQELVIIGVIPFITPVRVMPNKLDLQLSMTYKSLLELYYNSGKFMRELGVNPLEHKAGCVRCGGCSAINEAYKAI